MKLNSLVLCLTLTLLAVVTGTSGNVRITNNQNSARPAESAQQENKEKTIAYDIYGKQLRDDEKYIASRTLPNGRIIAYRKNQREIAALVKDLKEDGVTDEKLLDPKSWMTIVCWKSTGLGKCSGGCSLLQYCKGSGSSIERIKEPVGTIIFAWCNCVK